ncbi:MAG: hypothetical protein JWP22_2451 [Ramlibacter sp.]|jgi:hypothetical protein|nr:hypothetical protein [Ramlibacter sp.]MDB5913776.1 hypothetical protein [Ramlibacter sp.]
MSQPDQHQTIRNWAVTGNSRIVGSIYNRPGHVDGKTIMTSPVLQIRLMGESNTPVAFTESGNAYWLAEPSVAFGLDKAETFVWEMSRSEPTIAPPRKADPMLETTFMRMG